MEDDQEQADCGQNYTDTDTEGDAGAGYRVTRDQDNRTTVNVYQVIKQFNQSETVSGIRVQDDHNNSSNTNNTDFNDVYNETAWQPIDNVSIKHNEGSLSTNETGFVLVNVSRADLQDSLEQIRMANLTNNVTDAEVTLLRKRSVEDVRDTNTVHIARIQGEEPDILLLDRQQNITVNIFGNST